FSMILFAPPAHASTPTLFDNIQGGPCGSSCLVQITGVTSNMLVVAHVISNGGGNPCGSVTDSFSDTYTQQLILSSAGNSYSCIETAFTGQSGTLIVNYPGSSNTDRKSTRLNSSHRTISYAVFCLKKKNT